jgi:hypothetical protein
MRTILLSMALALSVAAAAAAVEATIISFEDGELNYSLKGTGTVTVTGQVDFKYISAKTGAESLARATSEPVKVKLTGEETPATIVVIPPEGSVSEVEIILFVDGEEKTRQTFYY